MSTRKFFTILVGGFCVIVLLMLVGPILMTIM